MKVRAKVRSWSASHSDAYVFSSGAWIRVGCVIGPESGTRCVAPATLPRGTRFDGTIMVPWQWVELALARES
jgi:hypothetical protein